MSLDNIRLPLTVINRIYNHFLVEVDLQVKPEVINIEGTFLNESDRNFLFIFNRAQDLFLTEEQTEFLSGTLSACKENIKDLAIVNFKKQGEKLSLRLAKSIKIIAFGIKSPAISLPFTVPEFQVQQHNDQTYMFVPELSVIEKDSALKLRLATSLKNMCSKKS